jgi:hypothetical protein
LFLIAASFGARHKKVTRRTVSYCFDCRFFWRKHKKVTSGTVSTCFAAFPKPNMFTELQVPGKLFLQHPFKVANLGKYFPN